MRASRGLALALGPMLLCLACAHPAPRPVRAPLPETLSRYLISPLEGSPFAGPRAADPEVAQAFAILLAGDLEAAESRASALASADPQDPASGALMGEVDLVRGRLVETVARLAPLAEEFPSYPAVQLTLARALELSGDGPGAFVAYQRVRSAVPVAAERAAALAPEVAAQVAERLGLALESGRDADVDRWLAWLERWLPREWASVEARRSVAAKRGDLAGELTAVRRLSAQSPADRALLWRLGELELTAGDPGKGLEIFEALAQRYPADPEVADGLARARFSWRLATLPSQVQAAVRKPQLTRADLATMVYWLVPGVRAGRPGAGAIASDVLDHPRREEIVRIVNFGVMRIDDTLHLFEPGRLASRSEVNATLGRLLVLFGKGSPCARLGVGLGELLSREAVCGLLVRCRVAKDAASCLVPGAPAGIEVLDSLRRTLDACGGSPR